jgi:hypothetical protein
MKRFTIVRRRIVTQIQTDQFDAETLEEALRDANTNQEFKASHEYNEWVNGAASYHTLTEDDVLEVEEID